MKSRLWKAVSCGFALATGHLTTAFCATFMGLGNLPGANECSVNDVSGDGTVVVGFCEFESSTEPFRWTAATGMVSLGTLTGHPFAIAESVSADGSVVVGRSGSFSNSEAFRWTETTGMLGLGYLLGGGSRSEATGVSADGSVVVGTSDSSLFQEAFRWTEATGMVGLGTITGHSDSAAGSISANGNVVVGTSYDGLDGQAFRWTEATGMIGLGYLPGGPGFQPFYTAEGTSADGAVVVGRGGQPTEREAFRWTEATGMVGLGDLPGGSEGSQAFDVSADGSVVVGSGDWSTGGGWKAFIWDATNGMRNLRDVLIDEGLDLTGWSLEIADGISADGKTIVGDNGEPYIATLDTSPNPPSPIDIGGTIKTVGGTEICAMVLASGQFMFSCNPPGMFSLTDLPLENDGTAKRQIYADGFFPKVDILTESSVDAVVMTRSGTCPSYNTPYDSAAVPGSAGKRIDISGKVVLQDSQTPICAMVLANGQYMFSCDGTGSYALNIPLDTNGQFKLQVYADGFAPVIQIFDEFRPNNDVRMTRASECQ